MLYVGDIRRRCALLVECVRYSNARKNFWLDGVADAEAGTEG